MNMRSSTVVGVIGGGTWGSTLSWLLAEKGHDVLLWLRDDRILEEINEKHLNSKYVPDLSLPPSIRATSLLQEVVCECHVIIIAVASHGFRKVVHQLGEHVDGSHILVHAVKGMEEGSFKRMSEILREETCCRKIGVISGPNLAKEIMMGFPSATVVASHYEEVILEIQELLTSERLRIYGNTDLVGVEMGGALKNIIAIAAGVADGFGFRANTKAMLLTRGMVEIARFGMHMGAQPETFNGLSGIGDLIATCSSDFSRNHYVGVSLARGKNLDEILHGMSVVAEGVKTTAAVHHFSTDAQIDMPISHGVYHILFDGKQPGEVLQELMIRERKYESLPRIFSKR
jgi:glycerol-3-phosphate dehydrogenase (NAD(P)+)